MYSNVNRLSESQTQILHKLWRNHAFTRSRTTKIDDITKHAPSHAQAKVKDALDDLIKRGIVVKIPHRGGAKVFINPSCRKQVERELRLYFDKI